MTSDFDLNADCPPLGSPSVDYRGHGGARPLIRQDDGRRAVERRRKKRLAEIEAQIRLHLGPVISDDLRRLLRRAAQLALAAESARDKLLRSSSNITVPDVTALEKLARQAERDLLGRVGMKPARAAVPGLDQLLPARA